MKRLLLLVLLAFPGCEEPAPSAVTIYHNAVVHTVDPKQPRVTAFAVKDDRFLTVGDLSAVGERVRRVDLQGRCVVPGLIDAHGHLAGLGALQRQLDLRDTRSFDELVQRVAQRASELSDGAWIRGGRWDHASWGQKDFPTHRDLSKVTPKHPVLLSRVDGHAALANALALKLAGITRETKDPEGGEILRDAQGEPTGMLIDKAIGLVRRVIPEGGGEATGTLWELAQTQCLRAGLTCVHDAGVSPGDLTDLRARYADGRLKLRAYVMLSGNPGIVRHITTNEPHADPRFSVRAIKLYMDGAMGSRGAWMLAPYSDRSGHTGLAVTEPARIHQLARAANKHGWQVCTHAIGDRANREVLDAYEAALRAHPPRDHRFRIEHAQCIHPDDIARFARLGVIASMQPTHATSDMRWAEDRVGVQRLGGCYAWRRLLASGARLAFGSDFPVESEKPLWGLYAAITRQDHEGRPQGGWTPHQRLTPAEALRLFTLDAAYAGFQENLLGSIEPGKLADFVVLDRDVLAVPPEELLETRVEMTVIGGQVVWQSE